MFLEIDISEKKENFSMANLHSHNYYEIYFLLEGKRDFFIENTLYSISNNTVIILPPFQMHKTEGGAFKRLNINISLDNFQNDEQNLLLQCAKKRIISIKNNLEIKKLLEKISILWTNKTKVNLTIIKILVKNIIVELFSIKDNKLYNSIITNFEKATPPLVLKIIKYINKNFSFEVSQKKLGEIFFISPSYVSKFFKKHTGFTISEYLLNVRINNAKELLLTTKNNIEFISEKCGFSSASYFGLIFKKKVGLSPLNYKKHF